MANHPNLNATAIRVDEIKTNAPSRGVPNVAGWRYVAVFSEAGRTGSAAHRGAYVLADHWDIVDDEPRQGSIPASRKAVKRSHARYLIVRYNDSEQIVDKTFTSEWPAWAGYPRLAQSIGRAEFVGPPKNLNEARDRATREFYDRQYQRGQHPAA